MQRLIILTILILATVPHAAWGLKKIDKAELDSQLKFYQGLKSLDVAFLQTKSLKGSNINVKFRGFLNVKFPDLVKWKIVHPGKSEVTIDEEKIHVSSYNKKGEYETRSFQRDDPRLTEIAGSLSLLYAWLKLDVDTIAENYKMERVTKNELKFTPLKPSAFSLLTLTTKGDGSLETLAITEANGDVMNFDFFKPKVKK